MVNNLIEFPGGNCRKNEEHEQEEKRTEHLNIHRLTEMLQFLAKLRSSDKASFNRRNIDVRAELLESATRDELFQTVNQSDKAEWIRHPSYYHAIVEKFKKGGLMPGRKSK